MAGTSPAMTQFALRNPNEYAPDGRSLGCSGLVFHVHDLDAAVHFRRRVGRVLQLGLSVSDRYEVGAGNSEFFDQMTLDRIGAALRKVLVVGLAAYGVGMASDDKGRALQIGIGKRPPQSLHRGQ